MRRQTLLLLLLVLPGCGDKKLAPVPPPPRQAAQKPQPSCTSPRQVHARMQAAIRDGKPGRLVELYAPDDRALYIWLLVYAANWAAKVKDAGETLQSLLSRHDVPQGGETPKDLAARRIWSRNWLRNVKLPPLAADLAAFIGPEFDELHRGALSELKIQDARATAKIGDQARRFVRIGRAWYLLAE